jgi:DNA polymerase III gamma/tau subunit
METSSIIDKLKSFLDDEGIKVDTDVLSTSLREFKSKR